jgi:hypothetical protein
MSRFGKKSGCPSSERVLAYIKKSLSPLSVRRVAIHVANCDFCGAERLFLARHTPTNEDYTPGPTSRQMRVTKKVLINRTVYEPQQRRAA